MNDTIHITNKRHINHTDERVFDVLMDLDSYASWWSGAKFTRLDENTLEVSPIGPGTFTLKLEQSKENEFIEFSYDGIFQGTGKWYIQGDSALSFISYSVDITIMHPFYKFINKIKPINKMHEK